ncbi:MAG: hypothetical protein HBSAPP03_05070 [Phycisphaerae bacterium]|nr:MAG: hypothetical protein HBSAPP03_05070 [Phycisphaerae bacterium]
MDTETHVNGVLEPDAAHTPSDGAAPEAGEAMGATRDAATAKLAQELAALRDTLAKAREALDHAERRHAIDLELLRADAVDLETARLLTATAVAGMQNADVAAAVADLRRAKPFLFRRRTAPSAMGSGASAPERPADRFAREARETGDRASLLRYLRARRAG